MLEECLTFGKPLLIENIEEELDPVLDPVLEKRYIRKGGCHPAAAGGTHTGRCTRCMPPG